MWMRWTLVAAALAALTACSATAPSAPEAGQQGAVVSYPSERNQLRELGWE